MGSEPNPLKGPDPDRDVKGPDHNVNWGLYYSVALVLTIACYQIFDFGILGFVAAFLSCAVWRFLLEPAK